MAEGGFVMEFLKCVLDWYGNSQFLMVVLMLSAVFPLRRSIPHTVLAGGFLTVCFSLCNGLGGWMMLQGRLPAMVNFQLFLLFVFLWALLFGYTALDIAASQLISTLLFFINSVYLCYRLGGGGFPSADGGRSVQNLMTILLLLLLVPVLRRMIHPIKIKMSTMYWVLADLTLAIMIVLSSSHAELPEQDDLGMVLILLTMNFTLYFLLVRVADETEKQMELALSNQSLMLQVRQMENIKPMLERTRQMRHELKNNYFLIESMLLEKRYEEAQKFLHEKIGPRLEEKELVATGNHFIDLLLSQKVNEARLKGIPVELDVLLPDQISINQEMLCGLLFNLWDNAIEASSDITDPGIYFSMNKVKGYIEIGNKIVCSVLANNPDLGTTKRDAENHGVGMGIIRQIVQRYDGNLTILERDNWFAVSAILADRMN